MIIYQSVLDMTCDVQIIGTTVHPETRTIATTQKKKRNVWHVQAINQNNDTNTWKRELFKPKGANRSLTESTNQWKIEIRIPSVVYVCCILFASMICMYLLLFY
eukprot:117860_1